MASCWLRWAPGNRMSARFETTFCDATRLETIWPASLALRAKRFGPAKDCKWVEKQLKRYVNVETDSPWTIHMRSKSGNVGE